MTITPSQLSLVRYPPERFVSATISNITGGGSISPSPLYLDGLNTHNKMVRLDQLVFTENSNVNYNVIADKVNYPSNQQGDVEYLSDQQPDRISIPALDDIQLIVSSSTNLTNYVLTHGLWVWVPTIIDKLANGVPLTSSEQSLLSKYATGWAPQLMPYKFIDILYQGKEYVFSGTLAQVTAADGQVPQGTVAYDSPPAGFFDKIEEIGIDASIGGTYTLAQQLTNNLQVYIERDVDKPLFNYPAAGFPMADTYKTNTGIFTGVARPVVIARNSWRVYVMASATLTNIPYRVRVKRCKEFEVHRAYWGLSGASGASALLAGVSQDIIDQVKVGVLQ